MRRVALIYDAKLPYDVKVIQGVARYLQEAGPWDVFIEERALQDQRLPDVRRWGMSGIIADLDDLHVAKILRRLELPIVGFGGGYGWRDLLPDVPYISTDNASIARLAAEHLIERGFRNFGFCGYRRTRINGWSAEREEAFVYHLGRKGRPCSVFTPSQRSTGAWTSFYEPLCTWLQSLPTPLGLMAANDKLARRALEACRLRGLRVPQEVAVIGVDNDEMICELSDPTLSSVVQDCARIGYEAAALLDRMMSGRASQHGFAVAPGGIVSRRSTDVLAIDDHRVRLALVLINEHAAEGWKVADVAKAAGVSRSTLENHFKATLRRSVSDELRRVRLELAKKLTVETQIPLKEIAARTAFRSVQHMTSIFRRYTGKTPAAFRRTGGGVGPSHTG